MNTNAFLAGYLTKNAAGLPNPADLVTLPKRAPWAAKPAPGPETKPAVDPALKEAPPTVTLAQAVLNTSKAKAVQSVNKSPTVVKPATKTERAQPFHSLAREVESQAFAPSTAVTADNTKPVAAAPKVTPAAAVTAPRAGAGVAERIINTLSARKKELSDVQLKAGE